MSCIVPRTCTEVRQADTEQDRDVPSRPLAEFRAVPAYVLLGAPGSGKSTSFEAESTALGEEARLVAARDFLVLEPDAHPEWRGKTLFIDGLDEVRAGGGDARTPFDKLRGRLDALGRPRFRVSCREADWLGTNDRSNLAKVSSDADLSVLRLDPLSDENIEQILTARSGMDARSFIATAQEKEVAGLLDNPQCLKMLAEVVTGGGGWPGSRLALFEQACRQTAREDNPEHIAAAERLSPSAVIPDDELLDAAGRLCAVLLISGSAGCAVGSRREDADYPDLSRCAGEHWEAARLAVSTKLFKAVAEGRCQSVHRHVAEFLAARHLARLMDGKGRNGRRARHGIPARRIVALMTGQDGGVVTELRGLSAWIAAHSSTARSELIRRDPIGVTLYGDAGRFSADERVMLLESLAAESRKLEEHLRGASLDPTQSISAAGSLVDSKTEQVLREILTDPRRNDERQAFVLFVLHAVAQGTPLPSLTDELVDVVRDNRRWPGVQRRALDALLHTGRSNQELASSLKYLLKDVHARTIVDPDDYILGTLLAKLYPGDLSPHDVWAYLTESVSTFFGRYFGFWRSYLVDNSSQAELAEHLDILVAQQPQLASALKSRSLQDVPAALLARGLEAHGQAIEAKRVYDWLGVGLMSDPKSDAIERIRTWLTQRPDIQKAVLLEGVKRASKLNGVEFGRCSRKIERRLHRADLPPDFGFWCLELAEVWVDQDSRVAEYFLQRAYASANGGVGAQGFSLEAVAHCARQHAVLNAIYVSISENDAGYRQEIGRLEQYLQSSRGSEEKRHDEWLRWVYANETPLRENRCVPSLIHQLASAYFGYLVGTEGDDPRARLRNALQNDRRLMDAALRALHGAIRRADLPDVKDILQLRDSNRQHLLALPVLASLAEIDPTASGARELDSLERNRVRKALAFYFCSHGIAEPPWYRWMICSYPSVVSEVLIQSAASPLRRGDERVNGVREVASRADHGEVARYAALPLLGNIPVRGTAARSDLAGLLWAALQYCEPEPLRELIDRKLSLTSMSVTQRVYWLAAGLVAAPQDYLGPLESYVRANENRTEYVAAFFDVGAAAPIRVEEYRGHTYFAQSSDDSHYRSVATYLGRRLGTRAVSCLVRLTEGTDSSSRTFGHLVRSLAVLPDSEAGATLESLAADPALSRWREELLRARDDQRIVRRDAAYRHPDVEQVCGTLDDGPPANPADLAALVADRLGELGDRIRNGNTDDWRQYWNEDRYGRPCNPKHEDSCRDALLSDLRQCLPDELDAQPEGQYANDKRADIRISCRDFQIPVEIKKNSHPKLWSALRDQLIARYIRDPATDGYGIYLMLWFGELDGQRTSPPPTGVRPKGPDALKARLEEALTPEEARKISVCVIDVSAPAADAQ